MFSLPEETFLERNNIITKLTRLSKEYSVSFDVKPTAYSNGYHSLLHVSNGTKGVGVRSPGVWFNKKPSANENSIVICTPVNGKTNYFTTERFPTNEWIGVKFEQTKVGAEYFYVIHINGVKVYEVKNNDVHDLENMVVYAGDPWDDAQPGYIRNLRIVNFVE